MLLQESYARRYINTIFVNILPRLCTSSIHRSNKRKWFQIEKGKKQSISHRNYNKCRLCRWRNILLCFDLRPGPQKMLFQGDAPEGSDTFQWPVIERDRVGGLRLIIWDKVKVPLCQTDWCTGREWPLNCMTVFSAWWRLNIRFQRSSGQSCGRWIII